MRASIVLGAVLPAFALANGYGYGEGSWSASSAPAYGASQYTVTSTSTSTGTKTQTLTAYMTKKTSSSVVLPKFSSVKSAFTKPTNVASVTTSSGPVQVTANSAPRGAVDMALAGIAGAALYIAL